MFLEVGKLTVISYFGKPAQMNNAKILKETAQVIKIFPLVILITNENTRE